MSDRYDLEIVTHVYAKSVPAYRAHLQYQAASLFYFRPEARVLWSIVLASTDYETIKLVQELQHRLRVDVEAVILSPGYQFRRAIGRNLRALKGSADRYWFTDVDYFFGAGCLDDLVSKTDASTGLVYPGKVWINPDHATGDAMSAATPENDLFPVFNASKFVQQKQKVCIGGIHIVGRDRLHETNPETGQPFGYCNAHPKYSKPVDPSEGFRRCRCDVPAKRLLGPPSRIDIGSVYRIRHSDAGRCFDAEGKRIQERAEGKTHD